MKKILTCTDGSTYASSVYDHTAWAARRTNAAVHVLHMLDPHRERAEIADLSGNIGPDSGDTLLKELVSLEETKNRLAREKGKAILEAARRHLAAAGVSEITVEQQHGKLVETVVRMEAGADMVVIGKRGESAELAEQHLGPNLERVIRTSIRPILVASREFSPIERLLIAFDGGPSSKKAVAFAVEDPLLRGLECHLLMVGRSSTTAGDEMQTAAKNLTAAGYSLNARHLPGHVEEVIGTTIKGENIQLLVMGAYGHSRIRHLIIGSATTSMVRTCNIPVLMFR